MIRKHLLKYRNHLNYAIFNFFLNASFGKYLNFNLLNCLSKITKFHWQIVRFENINRKINIEHASNGYVKIFPPKFYGEPAREEYAVYESKHVQVEHFSNSWVFPRSSLILMQEKNTALLEYNYIDSNDLIFTDYTIRGLVDNYVCYSIEPRKKVKIKKGISLLGKGSWNYFHMLFEYLPKLWFIYEDISDYVLLVDSDYEKYDSFRALINKLFLGEVLFVANDTSVFVEELLYVTTPLYLTFNKSGQFNVSDLVYNTKVFEWILFLNEALEKEAIGKDNEIEYCEKIFFTRNNKARSYNIEQIEGIAKQKGFKILDFSKFSFLQQFIIMKNVKIFAGPTGATFTNLIFCKPGTIGISWMHNAWGEFPLYSTLAEFANVNLLYLRVTSDNSEYHGNYYLDSNLFTNAIDLALSECKINS